MNYIIHIQDDQYKTLCLLKRINAKIFKCPPVINGSTLPTLNCHHLDKIHDVQNKKAEKKKYNNNKKK